jgi:hypothetical protein
VQRRSFAATKSIRRSPSSKSAATGLPCYKRRRNSSPWEPNPAGSHRSAPRPATSCDTPRRSHTLRTGGSSWLESHSQRSLAHAQAALVQRLRNPTNAKRGPSRFHLKLAHFSRRYR